MKKTDIMTIKELAAEVAATVNFSNPRESKIPYCKFSFLQDGAKPTAKKIPELIKKDYRACRIQSVLPYYDDDNFIAVLVGRDNPSYSIQFLAHLPAGISQQAAEERIFDALCKFIKYEPQDVNASIAVQVVGTDPDAYTTAIQTVCKEGICPICGGKLEYCGSEDADNGGIYEWNCTECGASGKEGFEKVFDGNHYDVEDEDGHSIEIVPPTKAETVKKRPVVRSGGIYSPQSYLEIVTGYCFFLKAKNDPVVEIEEILEKFSDESYWNYPLEEIDHIVENNIPVVLVDVSTVSENMVLRPAYRWFQVPEDYEADGAKHENS